MTFRSVPTRSARLGTVSARLTYRDATTGHVYATTMRGSIVPRSQSARDYTGSCSYWMSAGAWTDCFTASQRRLIDRTPRPLLLDHGVWTGWLEYRGQFRGPLMMKHCSRTLMAIAVFGAQPGCSDSTTTPSVIATAITVMERGWPNPEAVNRPDLLKLVAAVTDRDRGRRVAGRAVSWTVERGPVSFVTVHG